MLKSKFSTFWFEKTGKGQGQKCASKRKTHQGVKVALASQFETETLAGYKPSLKMDGSNGIQIYFKSRLDKKNVQESVK